MFKKLSISKKLLILVLIPVISASIFATIFIYKAYIKAHERYQIAVLIDVNTKVSALVHESQKERDMTAGFLGSKGQKFASELPKQRALFDEKRQQLIQAVKAIPEDLFNPAVFSGVNEAMLLMQNTNSVRTQVDNLSIPLSKALDHYTKMNGTYIDWITSQNQYSHDAEISSYLISYGAFLASKERAGLERAVLTNTFSRDSFAPGFFQRLIGLINQQEAYMHEFELMAAPYLLAFKQERMQNPAIAEVNRMRKIAIEKAETGGFGIDPTYWFKNITVKINELKVVEDKLSKEILELAKQKESDALSELVEASVLIILVIIVVFFAAFRIIQDITTSVNSITNAMTNVTNTGNFATRAEITSDDELGRIAKAYNNQMNKIENVINKTNDALAKISKGQFDVHLNETVQGDLEGLQNGLNQSAESINFMMSELNGVMQAIRDGELHHTMDPKVPEVFRQSIEKTLRDLYQTMQEINTAIQGVSNGDFSHTIQSRGKGMMHEVETAINSSIKNIRTIFREITEVTNKAGKKDLTARVRLNTKGEFTNLKDSINQMLDTLSVFVAETQRSTTALTQHANSITDEMHQISEESQSQAAAIEETAASLEEITSTVNQTDDHSTQAQSIARSANEKVNHAMSIMKKSLDSIHSIKEASQKISEITSLIDGIAFQTNLLALNAAVEAARAGEHGRGFAVVAGEVRNLAGRSADAASEIKGLIESTVSLVDTGSKQAEDSSHAVNEITNSIVEVGVMIDEISQAAKEQATSIQQINQAMSNIDSGVQRNSMMATEALNHAQSMKASADQVQDAISELKVDFTPALKET